MIVDDDDELLLRGGPGPKPPHQSRRKAKRISKLSKGKLHDKMAKAVVAMVGVKLGPAVNSVDGLSIGDLAAQPLPQLSPQVLQKVEKVTAAIFPTGSRLRGLAEEALLEAFAGWAPVAAAATRSISVLMALLVVLAVALRRQTAGEGFLDLVENYCGIQSSRNTKTSRADSG